MPGVQFNELESLNESDNKLSFISDLVQNGFVKIEGMNYSHAACSRNDTIDALVRFAEKAISEKTPFVFITDDPSLLVRLNCFSANNIILIFSPKEISAHFI